MDAQDVQRVTLILPLPSPHLSPNGRGGTRWRSSYVARARDEAVMVAQVAIYEQRIPLKLLPFPVVVAQETYYWPTKRRRDVRNAEASLKAYYDGFVRAGLLVDDDIDHLTHLPSRFAYDKEDPRVEVVITTVAAGGCP